MAYNFTVTSNSLVVTLDTESGKFEPETREYSKPNIVLGSDRILLKEGSLPVQGFVFASIGLIGTETPTNLIDAYETLESLIKSIFVVGSGGGGLSLINTTTGNDTDSAIIVSNGINPPSNIQTSGFNSGSYDLNWENGYSFTDGTNSRASQFGLFNLAGLKQKTNIRNDVFSLYRNDNITSSATFQAPNTGAGEFTQPISVNGNLADVDGNIFLGYKVYTALLTQTGTNAPTAIVLQNTLNHNPVFTYQINGIYDISLPVGVNENKIAVFISTTTLEGPTDIPTVIQYYISISPGSNIIQLYVGKGNTTVKSNNLLYKTPIEIRVYN